MGVRLSAAAFLVLGASGCRAEFDVARDALGPFRIAAMGVESGEGCPRATASLWSGEGLFHREAPQVSWSLNGDPIGEGWAVPVCGEGLLELSATNAEGEVRLGQVNVSLREGALSVSRAAVDLSSLELEERREVEAVEVHSIVPLGSATRVSVGGMTESDVLVWMSPDLRDGSGEVLPDQGELLELSETQADLLAENWTLDKEGLLETRSAYAGVDSHLALVMDGQGGNRFLWVDAGFGLNEAGFLRHSGRLIDAGVVPDNGLLAATLVETDDGVELTELAEASETDLVETDCAHGAPLFELDWIANGRCSVEELNGQRIVLEVW